MVERTPREVLEDHLQKAKEGRFEEDFALNFHPDCLHLTNYGVFRGLEGARRLMEILEDELPKGEYDYRKVLVEDDVGFLVWSGTSPKSRVPWGTDTYVFRDGKIAAMTFHYAVEPIDD
jgi:SnoaL-like protein